MTREERNPCGHPLSAIVSSDEGTSYCRNCAHEAWFRESVEREQWETEERERQEQERQQAEYEMVNDPTSDLYYSDAGKSMRSDAGMRS